MRRFLVLPRDPEGSWDEVSPAEMQRIVERYVAWTRRLAEEGRLEVGEKLRDGEGRVLRRRAGALDAADGPFVEAKEVVGGFWILRAEDLEAAQALLADCPHLEIGSLEVREIDETEEGR
jgi:hypothetical protein